MVAEKKIFANQVLEGQSVEDLFMIKEMSRAETRSGKPYLIMSLMDRSGELPGRLWENADALIALCKPGNLVQVTAQAQTYRGTLQLKIDSVSQVDKDKADLTFFLQTSKKNIEDMAREIHTLATGIQNPFYKNPLLKFFDDSIFFEKFQRKLIR